MKKLNCNLIEEEDSSQQFGSMPVLEEAKTMVYVTNHNMIISWSVFENFIAVQSLGDENRLAEIQVFCLRENEQFIRQILKNIPANMPAPDYLDKLLGHFQCFFKDQ